MILRQPCPGGSLSPKQPMHWGCFLICSLRPMQLLLFDGKTQDFSPPLSNQDHPSPWAQLHCAWSEYDESHSQRHTKHSILIMQRERKEHHQIFRTFREEKDHLDEVGGGYHGRQPKGVGPLGIEG